MPSYELPSDRSRLPGTATRHALVASILFPLFFFLLIASARAEGINLAWDNCASAVHGTTPATFNKAFACNSNTGGPFTLVASFVPPQNVNEFLGVSAQIDITTGTQTLPDWWAHGTGACRGTTNLSTSFDFSGGPYDCTDFNAGQAAGGFAYDVGYDTPNRARLRVQYAVPFDLRGPVNPANEYYAFKVNVQAGKTVGADACAGCSAPAIIQLTSLQLFQPPEAQFDPVINVPGIANVVYWQGRPDDGPHVLGFEPSAGPAGTHVALAGLGLAGVSHVEIGGVPAAFAAATDTTLGVTVPASPHTGPVTVVTPAGSSSSYQVFIAPAAIQSFAPPVSPTGTLVQILGYNLTGTTAVRFNGVPAQFNQVFDNELDATVPAGATTGPVSITNPAGTTTSVGDFVVDSARPIITRVVPPVGPVGSRVSIYGFHFRDVTQVQFNGVAAQYSVLSDTLITTIVPATTSGPIRITNREGVAVSSTDFRVANPLAPDITSFTPAVGGAGTVLAVTGHAFDGTQEVTIAGQMATFADVTDSTMHVTVPADPHTGPLVILTTLGLGQSDSLFIAPPVIGAFTPFQSPIGSTVTLHGYNFTRASQVAFHGVAATFTSVSDSVLRAVVPAGATTGRITMVNPAGAGSSTSDFRIGPAPPVIDSFAPVTGAPGAAVAIHGHWFTGTTHVTFGSIDATFTVAADSLIQATVPEDAVTSVIRVTNAVGTSASSTEFQVQAGAPVITSFSPESGLPGTSVAVVGTGFAAVNHVRFGASDAFFTLVDAHHLTAVVPDDAVTVNFTVTSPYGTAASPGPFVVVPPPVTVTAVQPGAADVGAAVMILGTGFYGTSRVTFGGVPATDYLVYSATRINTAVPGGARSGPVSVTSRGGTAFSAGSFIAPPVVQGLAPSRGVVGDAITITGYNFTGASRVVFGPAEAAFTIASDSVITATVPGGAAGRVVVTNAAGTGQSPYNFTLVNVAQAGGVDLSWNDCGTFGQEVQAFACNQTSGAPATLVASFVPPQGVTEFLGTSATLEIRSSTPTLPDWWKHGAGECRGANGLAVGFDFTQGPFACVDVMHGHAAGGFAYDVGFGGADRARLRVQYAIPFDDRLALDPTQEYYAFKVMVLRGGANCSGCDVPVTITLQDLQLFQRPELAFDPILTRTVHRNAVAWQQVVAAGDVGPNLVRNGSFESALDGWSPLYGARLERVNNGHDGLYALHAVSPDTSFEYGINDSPNIVPVTPAAGLHYRFGAWVHSDNAGVQIRAREYDANKVRLQKTYSTQAYGGAWQHVEGDLVTLQAGSSLDLLVVADGGPGSSFVVDGITLQTMGSGPVVTAPALASATVGTPVEVHVTVSNPGGQPLRGLTADLSTLPTGNDATFSAAPDFTSGVLRWTPQVEDGGATYPLRFRALGEREAVQTTMIQVAPVTYTNLVADPSFESGVWSWKAVGGTLDRVAGGRTGYWSAVATGRADSLKEFGMNDSPNWIATTPVAGLTYRIAAWVRGDAAQGVARLMVREYLNGAKVGVTTYSPDLKLGTGWQKVLVDRVAAVQGSTIDVQILGEPTKPGSRLYVDDVSIRALNATLAPGVWASRAGGDSTASAAPSMFPNPVHDRATLSLAIARQGPLSVELYDVNGRRVRTLFDRLAADPGEYRFEVTRSGNHGERLSPGIFFYRVRSADGERRGRFVILE